MVWLVVLPKSAREVRGNKIFKRTNMITTRANEYTMKLVEVAKI